MHSHSLYRQLIHPRVCIREDKLKMDPCRIWHLHGIVFYVGLGGVVSLVPTSLLWFLVGGQNYAFLTKTLFSPTSSKSFVSLGPCELFGWNAITLFHRSSLTRSGLIPPNIRFAYCAWMSKLSVGTSRRTYIWLGKAISLPGVTCVASQRWSNIEWSVLKRMHQRDLQIGFIFFMQEGLTTDIITASANTILFRYCRRIERAHLELRSLPSIRKAWSFIRLRSGPLKQKLGEKNRHGAISQQWKFKGTKRSFSKSLVHTRWVPAWTGCKRTFLRREFSD